MFKKLMILILIVTGVCDYVWCKALIAFPKYALWCYNTSGVKLFGGSFKFYIELCKMLTNISVPLSILGVLLLAFAITEAKES